MLKIYEIMAEGPPGALKYACKELGLTPGVVYSWVQDEMLAGKSTELYDILSRAQEAWCYAQVALTIEIADDDSKDVIESVDEKLDEDGEVIARRIERRSDNTAVNRADKRIRARQWAMAKLASKLFGDRIEQQITGKDGGPIQYAEIVDRPAKETFEEWMARRKLEIKKEAH